MDSGITSMSPGQSLTGTQLGKYQVRSEIGQGGMGTVYEAYDPTLDRFVALKVMAPHLTWEQEFVERFLREARAAARLKHPNIVTIYDVGRASGWYYFAMDYVKGRTLAQIIEDEAPMAVADVLRILRPLASALDCAHGQGLVHRDVKPSNVVVGEEGDVALTDFGIARAAQTTRLTRRGAVLGTPEYMAPEQARGDPVDRYADQYALGIVAYEMLAGRAPFIGESTPIVLYKIVHEGPTPLRAARPDLSEAVEGVLDRALTKEKEGRYASCTEFVDALEQAAQPGRVDLPSHISVSTSQVEGDRKPDSILLGLGGVGLVVVGLFCLIVTGVGILVGLLVMGGRDAASPPPTDTLVVQEATSTTSSSWEAATPSDGSATAPSPTAPVPVTDTPAFQPGSILFADSFEDQRSGWEIGDYQEGSVGYKNGAYSVVSGGELQWMWGVANQYFRDLIVEVDATQIYAGPENDNDYGVSCRLQPNGDGYHLVVTGDGYYAIYLREGGTFVPLVDFRPSSAVQRGNATNHIRAVCHGRTLTLFVNGQQLATVEDGTFAGGDIALSAESYEEARTEIHFDNLVVYAATE